MAAFLARAPVGSPGVRVPNGGQVSAPQRRGPDNFSPLPRRWLGHFSAKGREAKSGGGGATAGLPGLGSPELGFSLGFKLRPPRPGPAATPILGVKGEGCANPKRLVWPGPKAEARSRGGGRPSCPALRRGCPGKRPWGAQPPESGL